MHDYLRVIKLGVGAGKPGESVCWMTALQSHIGGQWTDQCECVDPTIRALCIMINDLYGEQNETRTEDILNFGLFRVLGTTGTLEEMHRRLFHLVDIALRRWAPECCRYLYDPALAAWLEALPPIVDVATLPYECELWHRSRGSTPADEVAKRITELCQKLSNTLGADPRGSAASDDTKVWSAAMGFLGTCIRAYPDGTGYTVYFIRTKLFPTLAELIELGPHAPDEPQTPACGVEEFHRLCGVGG